MRSLVILSTILMYFCVSTEAIPPKSTDVEDRILGLGACDHERTYVRPDVTTAQFKSAKIREAQADVEYYAAKVQSTEWLLAKAQVDVKYDRLRLNRTERLYEKKAAPLQELENVQRDVQQAELNTSYISSKLVEYRAELKAAQARLDQAQAVEILPAD